MHVHIK